MNFNGLTKFAQPMMTTIVRKSPTILTVLGVTGLVSTVAMAIGATPKAIDIIEFERGGTDETNRYVNDLTKMDIVKATWKVYVPTAAMGAITIGCIIGANSINLRRNAALASVYSISEMALKEYQAKVVEKLGSDKEREIRDEIQRDRVRRDRPSTNEVILAGAGKVLCKDSLSGRLFDSTVNNIERILNDLSRQLRTDMWIPVNDLYYELGLEATTLGDITGWHIDQGGIEAAFSTELAADGRPCLILDFVNQPRSLDRDC